MDGYLIVRCWEVQNIRDKENVKLIKDEEGFKHIFQVKHTATSLSLEQWKRQQKKNFTLKDSMPSTKY